MALMDFIKKQFIDILQWTESGDGTLAWRFPMQEMEIQNGASLTVRDSQVALFVNEGTVADVFAPGMYKLTTQTLPVLTYLKNWDKLFQNPFKSDVYFFSTRQQVDQRWGTTQPVTIRDKDFGAVRLRAFGNYAYRIADPKKFHTEISGTRDRYTVDDLDGQLRGLMLQHISDAVAASGVPFLDLAARPGVEQRIRIDRLERRRADERGFPIDVDNVWADLAQDAEHLGPPSCRIVRIAARASSIACSSPRHPSPARPRRWRNRPSPGSRPSPARRPGAARTGRPPGHR